MLAFSVLLNHLPEEVLPRLQERAQSTDRRDINRMIAVPGQTPRHRTSRPSKRAGMAPRCRFILSLVCLLTAGCSISSRFQQNLEIKPTISAARTAPSGSLKTESAGAVTDFNIDALGLSESSLSLSSRVQIDHGPLRVFVDHIQSSSETSGFFSGAIAGADLPAGNYSSDVELGSTRLLMAFPVTPRARGEEGDFDARLLAGLDLTAIRIHLNSTVDPAIYAEFDELAPAPVLGLQVDAPLAPSWNLSGIITFLPLDKITGYKAKSIDGSVRVEWKPDSRWDLFAGVRNHGLELSREADGRPIDLDVNLELIEVGVGFSF